MLIPIQPDPPDPTNRETTLSDTQHYNRLGCLVVLAGLAICIILAIWIDPKFWWGLGVFALIGIVFFRISTVREERFWQRELEKAFAGFPGSRPALEVGTSFGYPCFSLTFPTKEIMISAFETGHVESWVRTVVKNLNMPRFDPKKGISMTYAGLLDDHAEGFDPWYELSDSLWKEHVQAKTV